MKNKLTRKLMLSAFTLLFAVISLGASTYAWFTLSNKAVVETFEANVTVGSGLQLQALQANSTEEQLDPQKWEVSSLSIPQSFFTNVKFQAVTPKNKLNTVQGFVDVTAKDENGAYIEVDNTGYIQFDLYFKLSTPDAENTYDLYFDFYEFTSVASSWQIDKAYTGKNGNEANYSVGKTVTYYVEDAARLAITPADEDCEEVIYQAAGKYDESTLGCPEVNAAINYYKAVNGEDSIDYNEKCKYPDKSSVKSQNEGQKIGVLTGSEIVKITIFVWIEGWDAECFNAIFSQTLKTKLGFYLAPKKPITGQEG
jgi:hypothetical protein